MDEVAVLDSAPVEAVVNPKTDLLSKFRTARRVSTPLMAIRTQDPAATMALIEAGLTKKVKAESGDIESSAPPFLLWDCVRGIQWRNDQGLKACFYNLTDHDIGAPLPENDQEKLNFAAQLQKATVSPVAALQAIARAPAKTILFFANAHRMVTTSNPGVSQAVWNLRDIFKMNRRTLVLLCPDISLPAELQQDVFMLDEPLPDRDQLAIIVKTMYVDGKQEPPQEETLGHAVDALSGLAAFPAEQAAAMSLKKDGIQIDELWDRKCRIVQQTRGLSVYRGKETFDDVRGCDSLIEYLRAMMHGEDAPRGVVFMDEINDALAGAGTDSSGTKGDLVGTLLTHMVEKNSDGVLLIGPPGTGKTLIGKATAACTGKIMINFDIAGMQHGLVGSSGEYMRGGLAVVDATTQGRALWIGTCNSMSNLPPQLKRRFRDGTFMVDLPDASGHDQLWDLFEKKYKVGGPRPETPGWTGAEIENCCRKAWRLKISLKESAKYIVPVSISGAEQIAALRNEASGRFLSASKPGVYRYEKKASGSIQETRGRSIDIEE